MPSSPDNLDLQAIISQVEDVIRTFSAFNAYDLIDVTENTVKIKIYAQKDLYVQVYANFAKDKLNLTLIQGNERIYGEDSEGGILHIHPFNDPLFHSVSMEKLSIEVFFTKVQEYMEIDGLI